MLCTKEIHRKEVTAVVPTPISHLCENGRLVKGLNTVAQFVSGFFSNLDFVREACAVLFSMFLKIISLPNGFQFVVYISGASE